MDTGEYNLLENKIENLSQKVEEGFKGIHTRQDTTNGRIGKGEARIGALEKWVYIVIGGGIVLGLIPTFNIVIQQLIK